MGDFPRNGYRSPGFRLNLMKEREREREREKVMK